MRNWLKEEKASRGERPGGLSSDEREELARLRDENATLRMEREILTSANVEFIHTGVAALNRDTQHIVQGRPNMDYVLPNASAWRHHTICGHSPWFVRVDLTHALSHSAVFFHPTAEGQRELEREVLPATR